jgi:hypothetical protein
MWWTNQAVRSWAAGLLALELWRQLSGIEALHIANWRNRIERYNHANWTQLNLVHVPCPSSMLPEYSPKRSLNVP